MNSKDNLYVKTSVTLRCNMHVCARTHTHVTKLSPQRKGKQYVMVTNKKILLVTFPRATQYSPVVGLGFLFRMLGNWVALHGELSSN